MSRLLDVSQLPSYKFSHHGIIWWGTMGLIAVEGTVFALTVAAYFYLWSQAQSWPMSVPPPDLFWGTLNIVLLVVSIWPNHWTKKAGEDGNNRKIKIGLSICVLFGIAMLAVRALEFSALNVRWDQNAYGSILWVLLGLHTVHLATDVYDTAVLAAVFFSGRIEGKRHVDVSDNGMYWYFVVYSWLPIYAVLYWAPRLI